MEEVTRTNQVCSTVISCAPTKFAAPLFHAHQPSCSTIISRAPTKLQHHYFMRTNQVAAPLFHAHQPSLQHRYFTCINQVCSTVISRAPTKFAAPLFYAHQPSLQHRYFMRTNQVCSTVISSAPTTCANVDQLCCTISRAPPKLAAPLFHAHQPRVCICRPALLHHLTRTDQACSTIVSRALTKSAAPLHAQLPRVCKCGPCSLHHFVRTTQVCCTIARAATTCVQMWTMFAAPFRAHHPSLLHHFAQYLRHGSGHSRARFRHKPRHEYSTDAFCPNDGENDAAGHHLCAMDVSVVEVSH